MNFRSSSFWQRSFAAKLLVIYTGLWLAFSLATGVIIYRFISKNLEEKMGQQLLAMGLLIEKQLAHRPGWNFQPNLPGAASHISQTLQGFLDTGIIQNVTLLDDQGIILADATGESIPGFKNSRLSADQLTRLTRKQTVLLPVYSGDFGTLHQSVFIPFERHSILQIDADPRFLDVLSRFQNYSLLLGLAGLLLSALVSALVARTVLKPVGDIAALSQEIAEGRYPNQAFSSRADELGQLENALLRMSIQIQTREAELLRLKRAAENQAEQTKEIAGGIAHEVRTPLVVIRGEAEWIQKVTPAAAEITGSIEKIMAQVNALNHLVERFLEYSRAFQLNREEVDLEDLVKNVAKILPRPGNVRVAEEILDHPSARVDKVLLSNGLYNLALNALESMSQEGRLTLRLYTQGLQAVIEVEDTGDGILPENQSKIFMPFFTTKNSGTGLGLAFAQKIIQAHEGRLELVQSSSTGSLFRIFLPMEGADS